MTERPSTEAGERLLASSVGWVAPHPDDDGTFIPVVQDAMRESILAIETEAFMDGARASRQNRKEIEAAVGPPASAAAFRDSVAPIRRFLQGHEPMTDTWRADLLALLDEAQRKVEAGPPASAERVTPIDGIVAELMGVEAHLDEARERLIKANATLAAQPPPASVEAEGRKPTR